MDLKLITSPKFSYSQITFSDSVILYPLSPPFLSDLIIYLSSSSYYTLPLPSLLNTPLIWSILIQTKFKLLSNWYQTTHKQIPFTFRQSRLYNRPLFPPIRKNRFANSALLRKNRQYTYKILWWTKVGKWTNVGNWKIIIFFSRLLFSLISFDWYY